MDKKTQDAIAVYKPVGMTPAQVIDLFRLKYIKYKDEAISHAGKLDPMAEGVILLVTGKNTIQKNLKRYLGLDKEYKAKILFGFSTDSFDIQGIVKKGEETEINIDELKEKLLRLKGIYEQEIPVYSGRKINGKALYKLARKNKLSKINIPKEKVEIKDIFINGFSKIKSKDLLKEIRNKIGLLKGDFRQGHILEDWHEILNKEDKEYIVAEITLVCSSGTYIRAIANDLGRNYGGGVLCNLIRTQVGRYKLEDCLKV